MENPDRYFDPDPRPKEFPRPAGDMLKTLGSFRRTVELRASGSPVGQSHLFVRNTIMAAASLHMGYTQRQVADAFGITESRLSHILSEMEAFIPKTDPAA